MKPFVSAAFEWIGRVEEAVGGREEVEEFIDCERTGREADWASLLMLYSNPG